MKAISKKIISTLLAVFCLALLSSAQTEQIFSYNLKSIKSLSQVIDDLKVDFGLEFSFPSTLIEKYQIDQKVYQSDDLNQFIQSILSTTDLEYQIVDSRKILIRPKRSQIHYDISSNTDKIKIRGSVKDQNNDPISYVDVILDTLFIGSSTDDNGHFEFEIPSNLGNRNISFHLVGYHSKKKSIKENTLNSKTTLVSSITNIKEILLVEKVKSVELDSTSISSTNRSDYLNGIIAAPILSNDIQRSLQMTAGIDATNDLDASIRIRGSQSDETLIILDGIPIYKAEHFYGIFGSVNGNHINTVSVHKNNLPIEFGGKSGGLVEMKSKEYFNKLSAGVDINMLTTSATISATINDKWSFIASGRTTYDNAADSKIFNWIEPSPEEDLINKLLEGRPLLLNTFPVISFFDLNGKLLFRPNENHLFSLSAFNSQDNFNNSYDITFSNPLVNGTVEGQEDLSDQEDWRNFGISLQHSGAFKNKWKINTRLYNSFFNYSGSLSTSLRLERNGNAFFTSLTNKKSNDINDWGFHSILSKELNKNQLSIGFSGVHHDVGFGFEADNSRTFDFDASGWESALFSSYRLSIDAKWTVNIGGRLDYYSETDQVYLAPRISSNYKLSDHLTLKASYAQHYQFLREVTFYSRLREPLDIFLLTSDGKNNRTYPVGSSTNSMLGLSYIKDKWIFDVELYNKDMDGVIEHTEVIVGRSSDDIKTPTRINKAVTGTGRSYGADFSIGYQHKSQTTMLAYSLSKTTNQFEEIFRNEAIPAENDRRHQLKLTNQFDLGQWSITGNYVFASGRSQLNLFNQDEVLNLTDVLGDQSFTRLDPYHRVDIGVSYGFEIEGNQASIGLSVFNLTNNKNVDYIQYLFAVPTLRGDNNRNIVTGTTTQLLDRTFNLTFKVDW